MVFSRRVLLGVLSFSAFAFAQDASRPLVQPRLEELTLSPTFIITDVPTTRTYNWTIEMKEGAPDGFYRQMLVVNGQYPGPLIEANEGDTIIVHVTNKLPKVGTSLHWHGLFQNGTAWMDGPAGITQCPIPAGSSYTYEFKVQGQYGTYWWHAHAGAQLADGIHGPLIVHSTRDPLKRGVDYDFDQILIMADWYHNTSTEIVDGLRNPQGYDGTTAAPPPRSAMFNGFGTWDCETYGTPETCFTQKPYELEVIPDKTYRLRIINTAAHAMIWNSIDEHTLSVIEADDTPISSPAVNDLHRVQSHNGQRYSVLLKTDKGKLGDSFWMRGEMSKACFAYTTKDYNSTALAILRYGPTTDTSRPTTKDWKEEIGTSCRDIDTSALVPLVKEDAPTTVTQHGIFNTRVGYREDKVSEFYVNNVGFDHLWYRPVLYDVMEGRGVDGSRVASLTFDGSGAADIVINNLDPIDHPYHLHAFTFWIVGEGSGSLTEDAYRQMTFNTTNPLRRDTHVVPSRSWSVIRIMPDVPGVWFMHCHIDWHLAAGFAAVVVAQPDVIKQFQIPAPATDLCKHRPEGQGVNSTSLGKRESGSRMMRHRPHHGKRFSHDLGGNVGGL
ncbi:Multicopper oxidase [Ceratobasidium sp. AG-Ba]|nr:Multicopper oxidase [Ceratobasidium sp. AG-Ba]